MDEGRSCYTDPVLSLQRGCGLHKTATGMGRSALRSANLLLLLAISASSSQSVQLGEKSTRIYRDVNSIDGRNTEASNVTAHINICDSYPGE